MPFQGMSITGGLTITRRVSREQLKLARRWSREKLRPRRKAKLQPILRDQRSATVLWKKLRLAVDQGQLLRQELLRARARAVNLKVPRNAVVEVDAPDMLNKVPYHAQGNMDFHTHEKLQLRFMLRSEPSVVEALHRWWAAALRSAQSGGDVGAHTVSGERCIELYARIYTHLVPGLKSTIVYQTEARASAEQDWARDSKGKPHLERSAFMDAIFELADHYTPTLDAADYAAFLHELLDHVSIVPAGQPVLLWRLRPPCRLKRPPAPDVPQRAPVSASLGRRVSSGIRSPCKSPDHAPGTPGGGRGHRRRSGGSSGVGVGVGGGAEGLSAARLQRIDGFLPCVPSPSGKSALPDIGQPFHLQLPPRW